MELEPITKLNKDLVEEATTLSRQEVRYLIDSYYQMQEDRKRADNQIRALLESGEPHDVIAWLAKNSRALENQIKRALDAYSEGQEIGIWARSVVGVGPVIAAGLYAHIDITKAPTVGHIWAFAGLDPTSNWGKGEKRPWNAALKTLCWKIGESFVKVSGKDDAFYGHIYLQRKEMEIAKNINGDYADQAEAKLEKYKIGKTTDAYRWYAGCLSAKQAQAFYDLPSEKRAGFISKKAGEPGAGLPMLPPGHIQARAKRYAVKLFLSHWHEKMYEIHYGKKPPLPYPIAILGHAHKI